MTTPQNLQEAKKRLEQIFEQYKDSGEQAPILPVFEITEICDLENLKVLMREIDPARKVFETPVTKDEVGLHGLPLTTNHIIFCSSEYGTECSTIDPRIPDDFVSVVEDGFTNGNLHGCGCLVWHKTDNIHGFLVREAMYRCSEPVQADLDELSKQLGHQVVCYSDPAFEDDAQVCLTVLISTVEGLEEVPAIQRRLSDLSEKWYYSSNKRA